MKGLKGKVALKVYQPTQLDLLPQNLGDLIPSSHLARVVNEAVEGLDMRMLLSQYKGGGSSSYHPKLLLKAIFFAYTQKVYSARRIETLLHESVPMMWLCGQQKPDHNTIARFRVGALKDLLPAIFGEILLILVEKGAVNLDAMFTDGTKIEANANKYSWVWGKSVSKYKAGLLTKIEALLTEIDTLITKQEAEDTVLANVKQDGDTAVGTEDKGNKVENSVNLQERIKDLNARLTAKTKTSKSEEPKNEEPKNEEPKSEEPKSEAKPPRRSRAEQRAATVLKYLDKNLEKLQDYETKQTILDQRNSFSKTDPDATFMRTKDDHMKNGQLKPCYNVQISTNDQYILSYSLHQTPTDTTTLLPHLAHTTAQLATISKTLPTIQVADAGYGSEENYTYLAQQRLQAYIKYGSFHPEQSAAWRNNPHKASNLFYNADGDFMVCPMGQQMYKITAKQHTSTTGFVSQSSVYQAQNCAGCPMRGACHAAQGERRVERNHALEAHKALARENLNSERGRELRRQRNTDVEPVFGNIKHNSHFRRFSLRGLAKVTAEFGIIAIAHNLKKYATAAIKAAATSHTPPPTPDQPTNTNPHKHQNTSHKLKNAIFSRSFSVLISFVMKNKLTQKTAATKLAF